MAMISATGALAQNAPAPGMKTKVRPQPEAAVRAPFNRMLNAVEDDKFSAFVAPLDRTMRAAMTKNAFEDVVAQLAPRLKKGHSTVYLGQLRQGGFTVHLWKIKFKDGGDDTLAELSWKNRKVGGFLLR